MPAGRPMMMAPLVAANVLVVLLVLLVAAPARWIGGWIAERGAWRLVHAEGTVWRGSASVGIEDRDVIRLLPGRVAWRIMPREWLAGRIALSLEHPAMDNPVTVSQARSGLSVTAGRARLPAAVLVALGAPFNTVRPGGDLDVSWSALHLAGRDVEGHIDVTWSDARSALTPVAPLGSFRLTLDGRGGSTVVSLATLRGPLQLAGRGSAEGRRVRFTGTADAAPEFRPGLGALLGVLGRRAGDMAVLDWEVAW
jgi:general secretion pathway protein N